MNLSQFQSIEQTSALYEKITPLQLFTSFSLHSLALITLWYHHNLYLLVTWYSVSILLLVLRLYNKLCFLKQTLTIENHKQWLNRMFSFSLLLGISWGVLFLFTIDLTHQLELLVLTTIYFALIAISSSYLGVYLPSYFAYVLPPTILFILKLLLLGGSTFYVFSALILIFFFFISSLARNTYSASQDVSKLTYQNSSLFNAVVKQKERAENAVLAKNQFLAAASHDLRQPLHAQGLFITALEYSKLNQDAKILTKKLKTSNEALNSLLNGLLDITKLESNAKEYQPKKIALKPILERIKQQYFDLAAEKETQLQLIADDDIYVHSDEYLLSRLITNLVDNSVKFTHKGEILISTTTNSNKVLLTIADTGSGIPENLHQYVFEEFTQLDNSKNDREKGLGLGLSIVKRISQVISVPIELKSRIDKGSQFTLTIKKVSTRKTKLKKNKLNKKITNYSFNKKRILIIDDDKYILEGMNMIISQWGATVITAEDIDQAIEKLNNKKPDLIISDLRLRAGKTGIEAINKLRSIFNEKINAVLITGDTSAQRIGLANNAELQLMQKPVDAKVLQKTIHHFMKNE